MDLEWVPVEEWRQMSDDEQRAMIRANRVDLEDLPEHFRRDVEEMLADDRQAAKQE
jgi:predicted Fe-S protein YdhL (DUF1289 family)